MLEFCAGFGSFGQHHAGLFAGTVGVLFELDVGIVSSVNLEFSSGLAAVKVDSKGFLDG